MFFFNFEIKLLFTNTIYTSKKKKTLACTRFATPFFLPRNFQYSDKIILEDRSVLKYRTYVQIAINAKRVLDIQPPKRALDGCLKNAGGLSTPGPPPLRRFHRLRAALIYGLTSCSPSMHSLFIIIIYYGISP